jgi:hypothetical protein
MAGNQDTVPTPASGLGGLAELVKLLGGTKTTSNPGDTGALESTLAGLKGQDYTAMLQAIFNKAGGAIPGLQAGLSNAMGARTGGNSAMAATLQKLLADTTVNAQDQVAKLQAQNFQTQGQVGSSIAQATKGTTVQEGANLGGAAQNLAILAALKQLGVGKLFDSSTQSTDTAPTPVDMSGFQQPQQAPSYSAPMDMSSGAAFNSLMNSITPDAVYNSVTDVGNQVASNWQDAVTPTPIDMTGFQTQYQAPAYTPTAPDVFPLDTTDYTDPYLGFADGGLVTGRGGKTAPMEPDDTPAAENTEDTQEAIANARFDDGFTANMFMDTFRKMLADNGDKGFANGGIVKAKKFADGGTAVKAGGSRRSANPNVQTTGPRTQGVITPEILAPVIKAMAPSATSVSAPMSSSGGGSSLGGFNTGANNSFGGSPSAGAAIGRDTAGKIAGLNSLSGLTGGPAVPGGMLGIGLGLATAQNEKQALANTAVGVANMAAPGLGSTIAVGMNPTTANVANLGLSLATGVPGAIANGLLGLAGTSMGQLAANGIQNVNLGQTVNPTGNIVSQAIDGYSINNSEDPLGSLIGAMGWTDTPADTTNTEGGNNGGREGGFGSTNAANSANGGDANGVGGDNGGTASAANGGSIDGPGTGTSDSIKARLSDGEYVMSADTVEALGANFFDMLQKQFHKPVATRRA